MKTVSANAQTAHNDWLLIDAEGMVLGRLASRLAMILRGKHKPEYTPHVDTGDYVVVINASKMKVTGNKAADKMYYSHSNYPGGLKTISYGEFMDKSPERVLETAVKGMLPRGPLGRAMLKKLKVYAQGEHPHVAQNPKLIAQ